MSPEAALQSVAAGGTWFQRHVRVSSKMHARITDEDKLRFFQQLTTLFAAGTPLLEALWISSHQSQSVKMHQVIRTIAERVAGGLSLHQAAGDFPKVFDRQWIEVIKTGEGSGQLGNVLSSLTTHIVAAREMRGKLISAMIYPIIILCVAVGAVVVMLWKVVPVFADFFKEAGSKLPAITQTVIDLSNFLQKDGLYLVGGIVGTVFAVRYYLRTPTGRRLFQRAILTAPMIGDCAVQAYMERFATNMVLLLHSGLPLLEAIGSMQGVFQGNTVYCEALKRVQQRVAAGTRVAAALDETGLFTSMVISMVRVGEESGELATVLDQVATYYRKRVEAMLERLTGMIEPVVILGMGVTVAIILTSIYLPMFQMASGPGGK
ncbi:MAG: type II secretion system F family protein [Phycisphaerae bacterium]|nr:type II secretion system F family protein [Phycisphaerae bacterium]